jgi:hypothetical protein
MRESKVNLWWTLPAIIPRHQVSASLWYSTPLNSRNTQSATASWWSTTFSKLNSMYECAEKQLSPYMRVQRFRKPEILHLPSFKHRQRPSHMLPGLPVILFTPHCPQPSIHTNLFQLPESPRYTPSEPRRTRRSRRSHLRIPMAQTRAHKVEHAPPTEVVRVDGGPDGEVGECEERRNAGRVRRKGAFDGEQETGGGEVWNERFGVVFANCDVANDA